MRSALCALAAVLVAAAGAGCGGGGEEGAGAPAAPPAEKSPAVATSPLDDPAAPRPDPPPDQSRWAGQVDEACRPWQERIDAVPVPSDAESLEAWVEEALPLLRSQIAAVEGVKPPAKEEEARRARLFVDSLEQLEAALTRYLDAIRNRDTPAMQEALADAGEAGSQARTFALSLDVTECGGYSGG